jgi:hypothetical protein
VAAGTSEIFAPESPCVERGRAVALDPAATEGTIQAMKELVLGLGGAR